MDMRNSVIIASLFMLLVAFAGCSNSSNLPTQPNTPENSSSDTQMLYSGSFEIDLDSQTVSKIEPRQSDFVYNITGFLPDKCPGGCFRFEIINVVGTVLEIELTLENPVAVLAYDLRVVYLDLFGKTVLNPDSYTDFLGTPITNIHPFTEFMKGIPDRAFPMGPGGMDTETLFLDFPPGAVAAVNYAITVSLPSNAEEPYEVLETSQTGTLTPSGGSAFISCRVNDHQDNVSDVFLDATPFTGAPVQLLPTSGNVYEVEISNTEGAPIGNYNQLIMALSPNPQNISTYNYVMITVSEEPSDVIYVDDSYVGPPYDGTIDHPFNTITEGLAEASAGYEVWVDDSGNHYDESIRLVRNVILKSVNWDTSDGDDEATIYTSSAARCVLGVNDAVIEGFEIDGATCGIECEYASPEIINCRIVNCSGDGDVKGIWLHDGSRARISGVEVYNISKTNHNSAYGILVQNCNKIISEQVVIENTYVHHSPSATWDSSYGIYISDSRGTLLDNCTVYDLDGGWWSTVKGITVAGSDNTQLIFCTAYDIYSEDSYGISISNSPGVLLDDCYAYDVDSENWSSSRGISVAGSDNALLKSCTVYDIYTADYSGSYGIIISSSLNVQVEHCVVHGIEGLNYSNIHGILISGANGTVIENTIIHDVFSRFYDTVYGIKAVESSDVRLTNNVIYDIRKYYDG